VRLPLEDRYNSATQVRGKRRDTKEQLAMRHRNTSYRLAGEDIMN